jgi:hypothetical protein
MTALIVALAFAPVAVAHAKDSDRDGLSDRFEKRKSHTSPRKKDTDGDGLRDKYEVRGSHTSPRKRDTDGDGLSDGFEVNGSKTAPRRRDTDGDGLSDGYELKKSKSSPRKRDTDGDGLSDRYEVKVSNTSPRLADGDGDGLKDGVEILFGLDPKAGPGDDLPLPSPSDPAPPTDDPDPGPGPDPDGTPPSTSITGGPSGTMSVATANFSFSASEPGSSFTCKLDGGVWNPCNSPKSVSSLGEGGHTFYVRAEDSAGNVDPSPASRSWTVDLPPLPDVIPPDTSITGGPSGTTSSTSASFTFSSSEGGSTFECKLDSGAWGGCSTPKAYSGLSESSHTFSVRARDGAGNVDLLPASRTWTVNLPDPPPPPPPSGPADVFVTPGGNDSGSCTQGAPCRSLARAYAVASSGDVIGVGAGTYPSQTVPGGSKSVTFKGDAGAKLRQLDNGASNVTYDGIEVDGAFAKQLTFHNSGDNSTFKNGRIGNVTDEKGALVSGSNFTFDNVEFHDVRIATDGVHLECLYAIVVPGLTVKNSEFRNCAVFDIFFTYGFWWSPLPQAYGGVTLHNNFFGRTYNLGGSVGYYTVMAAFTGEAPVFPSCGSSSEPKGYITNWTVTNNTFELATAYIDDCPARRQGTFVWSGNTGG